LDVQLILGCVGVERVDGLGSYDLALDRQSGLRRGHRGYGGLRGEGKLGAARGEDI
jgi:hypothetical protein